MKEKGWKRGSNVAWKRAVKVIWALGRWWLDVGEENRNGGKEGAQEVSVMVIKALISCRLAMEEWGVL